MRTRAAGENRERARTYLPVFLLKEAGQDTGSFSKENLPTGGIHPFGELTVAASPYHDVMGYIKEEDEHHDPETLSPIPWVVSIDGFLSKS